MLALKIIIYSVTVQCFKIRRSVSLITKYWSSPEKSDNNFRVSDIARIKAASLRAGPPPPPLSSKIHWLSLYGSGTTVRLASNIIISNKKYFRCDNLRCKFRERVSRRDVRSLQVPVRPEKKAESSYSRWFRSRHCRGVNIQADMCAGSCDAPGPEFITRTPPVRSILTLNATKCRPCSLSSDDALELLTEVSKKRRLRRPINCGKGDVWGIWAISIRRP